MSRAAPWQRVRSRPAFVSVAALIVLAVLGLLLVGLAVRGARHHDLGADHLGGIRAYYAAEAGLVMAVREVAMDADLDDDGVVGGIAPRSEAFFGGATLSVTATAAGNEFSLVGHGRQGDGHRRLEAVVTREPDEDSLARPGLAVTYYASPTQVHELDDIDWDAVPDAMTVVDDLNWPRTNDAQPFWFNGPNNNYGARFGGYVHVDETGTWTFYTESDDGTRLWVDGEEVVVNDGEHSMRTRSGTIDLEAGWHEFEVRFFERQGSHGLIVSWQGPGVPFQTVIPASAFAHVPSDLPQPMSYLAARETIDIDGSGGGSACFVDSFNSLDGPYGGNNSAAEAITSINSTNDDAVEISRATIHGSVRIGPGGDVDAVVELGQNATVTGTIAAHTIDIAAPQVILPSGLPASDGDVEHSSGTHIYDADFRVDEWTVRNSAVVNVTSPIVGRIDNDLVFEDDASLVIGPGASLTLYVFDDVEIDGDARINVNTGDPTRLRLYMMGSNQDLLFADQSQLVARVFNPSGPLELSGSGGGAQSRLFGTYFGRRIEIGDRTRFHVDHRVSDASITGEGLIRVVQWVSRSPTD